MGQRYRRMEGQNPRPVCVAHNHDFAKGGDLQPKGLNFSQNVVIGRRDKLTSVTKTCRRWGFGGRVSSRRRLWGPGVEAPSRWAILYNALEKIARLIVMPFGSHFARF